MGSPSDRTPSPDLWEKLQERGQGLAAAMRPSNRRHVKRKGLPAEAVDAIYRCIICDDLVKEEFWSRPHVYLSRKTRAGESTMLIPIHEQCIEPCAALAEQQGYRLSVQDQP